jgi:hypothetical protein
MRSFACWAIAAAVALTSSSVFAAVGVSGTSARFAWAPSTGPVKSYLVEVARNGGPFQAEKTVSSPRVTITGKPDEKLNVRVVALGSNGARSAPSQISETIRFSVSGGADKSSSNTDKSSTDKSQKSTDKSRKSDDKSEKRADKSRKSDEKSGSSASGGSSQLPPLPASSARGAMPYDFNGDGRTDLLWHNVATNEVAVWLMKGASSPLVAVLGALQERWDPVGSGDFDGDGYADLLLRNARQGKSEIWLLQGRGVRGAASFNGRSKGWTPEAIGDFDGDGYADLLWRKKAKSLVWFMRGPDVDDEVSGPEAPELSMAVCAPELDGDGRSDLVWSGGKQTVAWLMEGSSPWRSGRAGPLMETSLVLGCGDADGDGLGDVLWYHPESRRAILWVMSGGTAKDRSFGLPPLRSGWAMEASGDFDGDGLANEIVLRQSSTGTIEIWNLRWNRARTSFTIGATRMTRRIDGAWQVVTP